MAVGCSSLTEFINEDNFIKNGPLTTEIGVRSSSMRTVSLRIVRWLQRWGVGGSSLTRTVSLRMVCWLQESQVGGVGGGFNLTEAHVTAVGPQRSEV